jgi:hypothetical protein
MTSSSSQLSIKFKAWRTLLPRQAFSVSGAGFPLQNIAFCAAAAELFLLVALGIGCLTGQPAAALRA